MQERITHWLVTFLHPYSLGGVDGERPHLRVSRSDVVVMRSVSSTRS
jgi:hypothetical protein